VRLRVWRSFAHLFEESRRLLAASVALSVLATAALVPVALVVKHVFDTLVPHHDVGGLLAAGVLILGMYVASAAIGLGNRYLVLKAVQRGITKLRGELLERVYSFPRAYFDRTSLGKLHATIVPDTQRLDVTANQFLGALVPSAIVIVGLCGVLVLIDAALVLALVVVMPMLLLVGRWLGRKVRRRTQQWHMRFDVFSSKTQLALRAMTLAKVSSAEPVELAARKIDHDKLGKANRDLAWAQAAYSTVQNTVAASAGMITLVLGGRAVARGELTIGALLSFYAVLALVLRQVTTVMFAVPLVTAGYESMVRLDAILSADEHEPYEGGRRIDFHGGIELDGVTFSYDAEPLLHDVSLRIEPGEHAALFGPNGAGKSTIVSLMLGLYRPRAGELRADGVPYDEVDVRALRKDVGVVLQDPVILPATIGENIAYGRPGASAEQIRAAAELATAATFIETLPNGYETYVGDEGGLLSGGQRQRIAIARALIARPALLILDEPTTYLDDRSISGLFENLLSLDGAPSVLLITHDPEVVLKMDTVHHLRDGHLVKTERHREPAAAATLAAVNA
jgi:ABC-type bacteriocin/lantibiotic exporter with double-glycine peptidase domain